MMNGTKKRVKGFTLVEMIVVIAIITILLGVIAPNLLSTYRRSRVNAANSDAKMVYNAVQTEAMHYISADRRIASDTNKSGFNGTLWISYEPGVGVKYSISPSMTDGAGLKSATGGDIAANEQAAAKTAKDVADKVNQVVSGARDVNWAVCVNKYIVKACVSSSATSSTCIGYYSANKSRADGYSDGSYSTKYVTLLSEYSGKYDAKK